MRMRQKKIRMALLFPDNFIFSYFNVFQLFFKAIDTIRQAMFESQRVWHMRHRQDQNCRIARMSGADLNLNYMKGYTALHRKPIRFITIIIAKEPLHLPFKFANM